AESERPTTVTTMSVASTLGPGAERPDGERADTLPTVAPVQRIPWTEAILGCPISIGAESIWSEPWLEHPWELEKLRLWEGSPWLAKLLELTSALVNTWDSPVQVTQTLMRGPIDMLSALLGNERTIFEIHDHPDECRELLELCTEAFIEIALAQQRLIPPLEGGYCSWFGIWAPGTVVRTQCDTSALIGPRWYKEVILPFEKRICEAFDYSIIHLHSGYLDTVEALLNVEKPQAIQIVIDPGGFGPPPLTLQPTFRRVLEKKPLLIEGRLTEREFETLLDELPGEGLFISAAIPEGED
ncbi:MAG TPA: hypothetical protein VJP78_14795, partial [Thermoleophilia bacterium]|nr:hypothetical protein [Thermoleophilia bacterium]